MGLILQGLSNPATMPVRTGVRGRTKLEKSANDYHIFKINIKDELMKQYENDMKLETLSSN